MSKIKKQYDIEIGLLSKLLETGDLSTLEDKQIKPYYFTGDNKKAFTFIKNYYKKNGSVPTKRIINLKHPSLDFETYIDNETLVEKIGTEEPISYWCDEIRKKNKHNVLCDTVEDMAQYLQDKETEKAYEIAKKSIMKIESTLEETNAININENSESRKEKYLKRKENQGMLGIPTGIPLLDYILKGLQPKQLLTLIARTGIGKANPLDTPVLTPEGFKPMRDIKVGSIVIGEDGKPYPVTAIYPQGVKDVYEVTFNDGTKSKCCKEHLWKFKTTDDRLRNNDWRVDTLENIMNKYPIKRNRAYNLVIPINEPVEFNYNDELIIDPYVLGILLGDGDFTTDRISLTNPEKDIIEKCDSILKDWGKFVVHKGTDCQYAFKSNNSRENKLYRSISNLELKLKRSNEKFIPLSYLYSSINDRRKLLKGLFDSEGTLDSKGNYSISTTSPKLKEDIMFLCRSLGYRCTSSTYDRRSQGKSIDYVVRIATDDIIFSSNKHQERYANRTITNKKHDYKVQKIVSIEKVGKEECQCISVDSKEHTYLVDDFIVTHNTWLWVMIASYAILNGYKVLFGVTEMAEEMIEDRIEAMLFGMTMGEFNYGRFKAGKFSQEEEEKYFEFLDKIKPKVSDCIIDSITSVSNLTAKINQYNPDLILIDSVYLMTDDQGAEQDWLRVAHITRDIKIVSKNTKKPIGINSQADSTTSKKTGPELDNIGYSSAIGQDSDVVLALFRDEQMLEDKESCIKVLKQREGETGNVMVNWDFTTMNFSGIYSDMKEQEQDMEENLVSI